jgi:DNA invertase Pin-like site-specific DNA recombinase
MSGSAWRTSIWTCGDALQQGGGRVIYKEAASGNGTGRSELEQSRKALRSGDTLVARRPDRLGRCSRDLAQIVAELERSGIGFGSLAEKIETASGVAKLVFPGFAALAESDVTDTAPSRPQRTKRMLPRRRP